MRRNSLFAGICIIIIGIAAAISLWQKDGDNTDFEKKWTFQAADLRNLNIISDYNVEMSFVRSTDGQNSIHLKGQGTSKMIDRLMVTEISDQILKLDMTRRSRSFLSFISLGSLNAQEQLIISVTDDMYWDSLSVKLDSGNLKLAGEQTARIREARLSTDSGNIALDRFKSEQLSIKVDSGNITGNHVTAQLTASTDSGNIKIEDMIGTAKLSTDSGNVKLYKVDTSNTDISTDVGNVYVQVPSTFAGTYDLKNDIGKIRAPESKRQTDEYIKVRSDIGNIEIEER